MAIIKNTALLDKVSYADITKTFVDKHNASIDLINILSLSQSTGAVTVGTIDLLIDSVATPITSNLTVGLGGVGQELALSLADWVFYFGATRSLVKIISSNLTLIGTKGFIYITEDGELTITSASYATYQPNRIRLLHFSINQNNQISLTVMPEMASTPRYLRSISLNQKLLQLVDFNLQLGDAKSFRRFSTQAIIEGSGCLSMLDEHLLNIPDENIVRLVDENSNVEYTELDTGDVGTNFVTKQLWLTFDGKLVVQPGPTEYASLEEAMTELQYEYYPAINGDALGEYIPVARIAHLQGATDLRDVNEAYLLNLTKVFELRQGLVWYAK